MQCRGINRKDCSQVTDFGKFGFQSLLRRLGVLEKKLKVRHLRAVFSLEDFLFFTWARTSSAKISAARLKLPLRASHLNSGD